MRSPHEDRSRLRAAADEAHARWTAALGSAEISLDQGKALQTLCEEGTDEEVSRR